MFQGATFRCKNIHSDASFNIQSPAIPVARDGDQVVAVEEPSLACWPVARRSFVVAPAVVAVVAAAAAAAAGAGAAGAADVADVADVADAADAAAGAGAAAIVAVAVVAAAAAAAAVAVVYTAEGSDSIADTYL